MGDFGAAASAAFASWPPAGVGLSPDCRGDTLPAAWRAAVADAAAGDCFRR
jgi:hypothetical protein